ncbi:MAG TPA: tyrosine-type recombinase/integrase [Methanocorpusculum sp.]|nr:tyrosine-type recombinase/integrase [Methanocorpusculum sp.]
MTENAYIRNEDFPVSGFLQYYDREKTVENYRSAIQRYLLNICPSDLAYDLPSLDRVAREYLEEVKTGRSVVSDLMYVGNVYLRRYAPSTIRLLLTSVCLWLEDCGVALSHRERQRIFMRLPPTYPIRVEAELTRTMFQKIYRNFPYDWLRVLLLMLLASGMRIGEALVLEEGDVDWTESRVSIRIPPQVTKTRVGRVVYLTDEAAEALKSYLAATAGCRKDSRIFPYSCAAAERYMRTAVDAAGYGKKGGRPRLVHWHMTRKWFISRFSLYASKEVAEELAGHVGYLSRSYQRFTRRQILNQYRKAEKYLELFPQTAEPIENSIPHYPNGGIETFIGLQEQ